MDDTQFAIADESAVRKAAESDKDGVILFKKFDEGRNDYDGKVNEKDLKCTFI